MAGYDASLKGYTKIAKELSRMARDNYKDKEY